jgi:hypothetical protein
MILRGLIMKKLIYIAVFTLALLVATPQVFETNNAS